MAATDDPVASDAPPAAGALTRGRGSGPRTLRDTPRRRAEDHPVRRLLALFGLILAAGSLLLMLPVATRDGAVTSPVVAFFTATSALTGTGLVVVDTGTHWTGFGQAVIMSLVLLGGIGIIAGTGLVLVILGRRSDLRSRLVLSGMAGSPLGDTRGIVLRTTLFVLGLTAAGAVVLGLLFWGRGMDLLGAAWWGWFHAASAFNNAGFDLVGGYRGFTPFAGDLGIVVATATLMLVGSLGLVALSEVWAQRRWRLVSVESRLVLLTSAMLVLGGAIAILLSEWSNPGTLGPMGPVERTANAVFASISARSTGMNTVDVAALRPETQALTTILMFIGGAVGSTAGGIRVNTLAVFVVVIVSVLRRQSDPAALGRRLEPRTVYLALTVTGIAVVIVGAGNLAIQLLVGTEDPAIRSAVGFEVVSAFGTVGLSTGLTGQLSDAAQLSLAACMLLGRVSVLALAVLFTQGIRTRRGRPPRGIMRVA